MSKKTAPLDNLPSNLPELLNGREAEASRIAHWLQQCRVVTLLGPSSSGKTTLALHVASTFLNDFPDGTFHIRLNQISRPEAIFQAIAHSLEISASPRRSLLDTVKSELSTRKALLILDDFEQVIGAANLIGDLVRTTQQVRFLIVSRDLTSFPPGMVMVVSEHPDSPAGLAQYARQFQTVNFFVSRLQAAAPGFDLSDANAKNVLAVCAQFGSIPIATDLIAIQSKTTPPQTTLEQLGEKLEASFSCQVVWEQNQLLKTLLEWVDSLLTPAERECLRRLGIFAGDFCAEAAQEICQDRTLSRTQILDSLSALLSRSLLRLDENTHGQERYFLLEPVREYAVQQIAQQNLIETLRHQHAQYYVKLAEQAEPALLGEQQLEWMRRIEAEYPNLRAAMLWSIEQGETELALRLTGALYRYWNRRSYFSEGHSWLEKAVALPGDVPLPVRIKAERSLGALSRLQNDLVGAEQHFGESLRLARLLGDQGMIAQSLNGMAIIAHEQHRLTEARTYYEEGLGLARLSNNQVAACNLLGNLALLAVTQGRYADAEAYFKETLEIEQARGDTLGAAGVLSNWASMNIHRGKLDEAEQLIEKAASSIQAQDSLDLSSSLLLLQGTIDYYRGDLSVARQKFAKSLSITQGLGAKTSNIECLLQLALVAYELGDFATAQGHFDELIAQAEELGEQADLTDLLDTAAGFALARQRLTEAARLYAAAETRRTRLGEAYAEIDLPRYRRHLEILHTHLDEAQFQAHWQAGQTLADAELLALIRAIG